MQSEYIRNRPRLDLSASSKTKLLGKVECRDTQEENAAGFYSQPVAAFFAPSFCLYITGTRLGDADRNVDSAVAWSNSQDARALFAGKGG